MSIPLLAMYLLSVVLAVVSYPVSRGPDGKFTAFFIAFTVVAVVYVALAWITRHQPIWLHLGAHLLLFGGAVALGMAPKPRLDGMAGMMYLFAGIAVVGMIILACAARGLARWF